MVFFFFCYEVVMVLSGVGDVLGYKNGFWEFCYNGKDIFKELKFFGGIKVLNVKCKLFIIFYILVLN